LSSILQGKGHKPANVHHSPLSRNNYGIECR
jgi:hypothetical protein